MCECESRNGFSLQCGLVSEAGGKKTSKIPARLSQIAEVPELGPSAVCQKDMAWGRFLGFLRRRGTVFGAYQVFMVIKAGLQRVLRLF